MVAAPLGARRPSRRRREWPEWRAGLADPVDRRTRLAGWGLVAGGAALVPWMGVLAARLPSTTQVSNWSAAWIGLDAALATGLIATGTLLARGDVRHSLTAAATASLLVMDAWFDVTTAPAGPGRTAALALAAGVELPVAGLCATLAVRALTRDPDMPEKARTRGPNPAGHPAVRSLRPLPAYPEPTGVRETDETE
ncbi:hypothetical protein [Actinomadura rugatobispora]|uniref:DUF2637 domain-containing protein n=1 Tax=Actinomadura rugatobispora TaxID=1994 RepID=A0ABW1A3X5_9ACTN|nr:hypothetical protein GCM10010200_013530 [Actinomadura rugatobispora]